MRSTFVWALCLAALVLASSLLTAVLRETPDYVVAGLVVFSFAAAGAGVLLNWRLSRAYSESLRDPLTGLPNRVLLDDRVEQALKRARRSGEPFTLIAVDLDGFKDVNDVRGHRAGDMVLRTLARRLEAIIRESDTVARVGGDEFVVLSMGTGADKDDAGALVGRLRHALRRPFRVDGATVEIDGSIGWAVYPEDGATAEELLARADGQMYATKRDTNDESPIFRRGVDAGVVRDVESALERKELVVVYQPIIDLRSGTTQSAEALVRRLLPGRGLVPPAEFVPHVERTPVMRELTFLVLADALDAARLWSLEGHDLGVSVNVPYRLLDDPQFADGIAALLEPLDLPIQVTLEVVPSGPGAGAELDDDVLRQFRGLGVRLSLDDGGRAASFAALRVLPLDELKIDAGFVHGLGRSSTDAALVHGMIDIGHALGLKVVAEGVETRDAWSILSDWGCDYAQGFYVASPRPAIELVDWLRGRWPAVA